MRKALTLIEVLFFVAVVAILVAVFMRARVGARARAMRRACVSTVKDLGVSYAFYRDECADAYPNFATSGECLYVMYDYDFVDGAEAFRCPAERAAPIAIDHARRTLLGASYAQDASPTRSAGIPPAASVERAVFGDRGPEVHGDTCSLLFEDLHAGYADVNATDGTVPNPLVPDDDTRVYVDEPGTQEQQRLDASIDDDSPNPDA